MIRLEKLASYFTLHKVRIRKRQYAIPTNSMVLFLIPLFTYVTGKLIGIQYNEREWIFPVIIIVVFIFWFVINYKFVKR